MREGTKTSPKTIIVDLAERSYPIHIGSGLLSGAGELLAQHIGAGRIVIITDETVASLHLTSLMSGLVGGQIETIILPPGEATKSFDVLQDVLDQLLRANFTRDDTLVAFGGGVIGDLTGFVASILKRGCNFVQIPTTLLAQVDSSVGGKTAINTPAGKNLVGQFYQPKCVLIDTDVLATLDDRHMRAGYAEVLKYALINDPGFWGWLDANAGAVLSRDETALRTAIATSCTAKAAIVKRDEFERGERALLNLGHTFAHALEAVARYSGSLLHGEAVSAGMLMAFEYSEILGLCASEDVEQLRTHLTQHKMTMLPGLPTKLKIDPGALLAFMERDKKNTRRDINLVLTRGIGKAFIHRAADKTSLLKFLKKACKS